jgi:hypothetical protein
METLREQISTSKSCSSVPNDVYLCRKDDVDEDDEIDVDIEDVESDNDDRKTSTTMTIPTNDKFSIDSLLRRNRETSTSELLTSNAERLTSNIFNKNVSMSAAISALMVNISLNQVQHLQIQNKTFKNKFHKRIVLQHSE